MIRGSRSIYVPGRSRGPAVPRRADPPSAFREVFGRRLGSATAGMNPLALNAIAQAIQTQEGYYPGSLSYQNNNPGNLVFAGQPGATAGPGGFAVFSTYAAGYQAELNQINLDAVRGTDVNGNPIDNVADLLSSWAPPSANDTATYISNVTAATGYDPSAPLLSLGAPGDPGLVSQVSASMDATADDSLDVFSGVASVPSSAWLMIAGSVAALFLFARR
jgi:hypothetical protein